MPGVNRRQASARGKALFKSAIKADAPSFVDDDEKKMKIARVQKTCPNCGSLDIARALRRTNWHAGKAVGVVRNMIPSWVVEMGKDRINKVKKMKHAYPRTLTVNIALALRDCGWDIEEATAALQEDGQLKEGK